MRSAVVLILAAALIGCATHTTHDIRARYSRLHPGMSKTEVEAILGKPGNSQFYEDREVWQYRSFGMVETDHLVLTFRGGKLVGQQNATANTHHNYHRMRDVE